MEDSKFCNREGELNEIIQEALVKLNSINSINTNSPILTFCSLNKIIEDAFTYLERLDQSKNGE